MKKSEIKELLKKRDAIIAQSTDKNRVVEFKKADAIKKKITATFIADYYAYDVDFIIEALTHFGDSPNIIYDDNGLFAVTGDGFHKFVYGNQKIEGAFTVLVDKKQWKKTMRLALWYYLKN